MTEQHCHRYVKRIAIPDRPRSEAEARKYKRYNKGPRWILARQCRCGEYQAYDLTYTKPGTAPTKALEPAL